METKDLDLLNFENLANLCILGQPNMLLFIQRWILAKLLLIHQKLKLKSYQILVFSL